MWLYKNQSIEDIDFKKFKSFVYIITNTITGRQYIGKKQLQFTRTKQIKGVKKKIKVESDWKTYTGSNDSLNKDIEILGLDHFIFEILHFCETIGQASYLEAKEQFLHGVLESDNFYNEWIMLKARKTKYIKDLNGRRTSDSQESE